MNLVIYDFCDSCGRVVTNFNENMMKSTCSECIGSRNKINTDTAPKAVFVDKLSQIINENVFVKKLEEDGLSWNSIPNREDLDVEKLASDRRGKFKEKCSFTPVLINNILYLKHITARMVIDYTIGGRDKLLFKLENGIDDRDKLSISILLLYALDNGSRSADDPNRVIIDIKKFDNYMKKGEIGKNIGFSVGKILRQLEEIIPTYEDHIIATRSGVIAKEFDEKIRDNPYGVILNNFKSNFEADLFQKLLDEKGYTVESQDNDFTKRRDLKVVTLEEDFHGR